MHISHQVRYRIALFLVTRSTMDAAKNCFLQTNFIGITLFVDGMPTGYCQDNLPLIADQISPRTRYPFSVDATFTVSSSLMESVTTNIFNS